MRHISTVMALLPLFVYGHAHADTLYLKSGEKIKCEIAGSSKKVTMIRNEQGEYQSYPSDSIAKIEKDDFVVPEKVIPKPQEQAPKSKKSVTVSKFADVIDTPQYLLYKPAGIDAAKKYPLVIALSPSADAQSMIATWKKVSDRYTWIILASKEFRNGVASEPILSRLASTVDELSSRLPIDTTKVIATGNSGGGMGAHQFAFLYPRLISAIVINTGMMHEYYAAKRDSYPRGRIAVFLASPTDFRYQEMKNNRQFLESLDWKTKWIEFKGGHSMAPMSVYQEATAWLSEQLH